MSIEAEHILHQEDMRAGTITPVVLDAPSPWHAVLLPMKFPVREAARLELQRMQQLAANLCEERTLERSVFLQLDHLHRDNAIQQINHNGRRWEPEMGLGIYPQAPAPRYWTSEYFLERAYTDPIPALMHNVMHLDTGETNLQHACDCMTGTGGLVQVLRNGKRPALRAAWYETLQPTIQEPGLAASPLYVPLLGVASLASASTDLDRWMGPADIYLRESDEDQGIFILSRYEFISALKSSGIISIMQDETLNRDTATANKLHDNKQDIDQQQ